jgi:hypothetical protein
MRNILAALALLSSSPAYAQDISAQLLEIAGKDSLKAALAAEAALSSPSATIRSVALEAILRSTDGRVRAVGYGYLVKNQKLFVIEVDLPPNAGTDRDKSRFLYDVRHNPPLRIPVERYDSATGQFQAFSAGFGTRTANIARDGMTIPFNWHGTECSVRFNAVEGEYLVGPMKCEVHTFKAKSALP